MNKLEYQEVLAVYKADHSKWKSGLEEELRRIFDGFVISSVNGTSTGNHAVAKVKSDFYKKTMPLKILVKYGPADAHLVYSGIEDLINHIDHYKCSPTKNPFVGDGYWNGYGKSIWENAKDYFLRELKNQALTIWSISTSDLVQMALDGSPYVEHVQSIITAINTSDKAAAKRTKYKIKVGTEKIRPLMRELLNNGLSPDDINEMVKEEVVRIIQGA